MLLNDHGNTEKEGRFKVWIACLQSWDTNQSTRKVNSETVSSGMQRDITEEHRISSIWILHLIMMHSYCLPTNKASSTYSMPVVQN